jgi:hypothetical protein
MNCDNCANYKPRQPGIDPKLVCRAIDRGEPVELKMSGWNEFTPATIVAKRYWRLSNGSVVVYDVSGRDYVVGLNERRILSARRVDCVDRATIRDEDTVTMRAASLEHNGTWIGPWRIGKDFVGSVVTKHTPAQRKVTAYKVVKAWPGVNGGVLNRCGIAWHEPSTGGFLSEAEVVQAVRDGYLEAVYE